MITIYKYVKTAKMTMQSSTNAGLFYLLPNYLLRVIYLLPLLMLWRVLMQGGVDTGMALSQMLTYTFVSTILSELITIQSPLTDWLYDGLIISLYNRPLSIYGSVITQTIGKAMPALLFFSLPMALLSQLFGVSIVPSSVLFFPSLLLCISLGFAIDFLFACLLIRMMNARWLVFSIRNAVTWLFSGSFIPFAVLPWNMGEILKYLPLGSLGGATLGIYAGLEPPVATILVQLAWNIVLWPLSIMAFRKSQERLVSHGG